MQWDGGKEASACMGRRPTCALHAAPAPADDQASGWSCQRCPIELHAALCYHKSPASAAALCMFDCRAPLGMVARYATHHRSMYPHLETAREHYLFTSHAGTPVAVWDCRRVGAGARSPPVTPSMCRPPAAHKRAALRSPCWRRPCVHELRALRCTPSAAGT